MKKRKIEYERDNDLLTHLLNHRAFQAEVSKRLKEEDVKTAAKILNELTIYNSVVGRMSGDEFCAFIYGYEDKQQIKEIREICKPDSRNKVQ